MVFADHVREPCHRVSVALPSVKTVEWAHVRVSLVVVLSSLLLRPKSKNLAMSRRRIDSVFVPDVFVDAVACDRIVLVHDISQYLQAVNRHGRGRAVCFSVARRGCQQCQKKLKSKFFAMLASPSKTEKHRVRPRKHLLHPAQRCAAEHRDYIYALR